MPTTYMVTAAVLLAIALVAAIGLVLRVRRAHDVVVAEKDRLRQRLTPVLDAEAEARRIRIEADIYVNRLRADAEAQAKQVIASADSEAKRRIAEASVQESASRTAAAAEDERLRLLSAEVQSISAQLYALRAELSALDEQANLQSFGFYQAHYDYDTSVAYKSEEERVRSVQSAMLKAGTAAVCDTEWQVGGSKAAGSKMTNQTLRLMLRAFNGECDAAVARVKYNNIGVMTTRIRKAFEAINKAASVQQC